MKKQNPKTMDPQVLKETFANSLMAEEVSKLIDENRDLLIERVKIRAAKLKEQAMNKAAK